MSFPHPRYLLDIDKHRKPYFTADLSTLRYRNFSRHLLANDVAFFTEKFLPVSLRATNRFSGDLTDRDDVLLAFLAMFLLLVIEGVVGTILLGTTSGEVSSAGFSIKCIVEVLRDFDWNFRQLRSIRRRKTTRNVKRKKKSFPVLSVNHRLILFAIFMLACIFGLEVLILLLTTPIMKPVWNKSISIRMQTPAIPDWRSIRWALRTAIDKPCESVTLLGKGVDDGRTRITGCVLANVTGVALSSFEELSYGELNITTNIHEYGAEHTVSSNTSGGYHGRYSTRGLLTLGDGRARLMRQWKVEEQERKVEAVHLQFLGYLYSLHAIHVKKTGLEKTLELLNSVNITFNTEKGAPIKVLDIDGRDIKFNSTRYDIKVNSTRYVSRMVGKMPTGKMILHFAQHLFRSSAVVRISNGDEKDLFEKEGIQTVSAVVWCEKVRVLNWLTLLILLVIMLLLLGVLRVRLKPLSTVNLASEYVKRAVGADLSRSPIEVNQDEDWFFRMGEVKERGVPLSTAPIDGTMEYTYGTGANKGSSFAWMDYSDAED